MFRCCCMAAFLAATVGITRRTTRAVAIEIEPGDHIAIVGNTLADRMQHDG